MKEKRRRQAVSLFLVLAILMTGCQGKQHAQDSQERSGEKIEAGKLAQSVRDKYADALAEQQDIKEKNFEIMQTFATEHREELFSRRKSYESAHGTFGFRTGTPKLKNIKGFTWASVTNLVKEFLPEYIRVSEELAKDRLLADRDKEEVAEQLSKCGMTIVQDETFYVEPKKENEQPS